MFWTEAIRISIPRVPTTGRISSFGPTEPYDAITTFTRRLLGGSRSHSRIPPQGPTVHRAWRSLGSVRASVGEVVDAYGQDPRQTPGHPRDVVSRSLEYRSHSALLRAAARV